MAQASTKRAHRSTICQEILSILEETASSYADRGDPESDLRDAPEYLINVNLAQGLTVAFPALRYRLEHHASAFDDVARAKIDARKALGKDTARFDIVLLNKANKVPRCIIEIKRGHKIMGDANRIIAIAALESGRPRWRHGYLVTILRRSESEAHRLVGALASQIESLRPPTESADRPVHQAVKVTTAIRRIGASRINPESNAIYGLVFQVALIDRATPRGCG